jgi:hypothetical protein
MKRNEAAHVTDPPSATIRYVLRWYHAFVYLLSVKLQTAVLCSARLVICGFIILCMSCIDNLYDERRLKKLVSSI